MKLYDKVYYELDPFFPALCQRLTSGEKLGVYSGPVVVMTESELLDLLQEVIEYSQVTLIRSSAENFLNDKLKNR